MTDKALTLLGKERQAEFKALLMRLRNASFACGEYDGNDQEEYAELMAESNRAYQAVLDAIGPEASLAATPTTAAQGKAIIEECAKVCEETDDVEVPHSYDAQLGDAAATRRACAAAIRALNPKEEHNQQD